MSKTIKTATERVYFDEENRTAYVEIATAEFPDGTEQAFMDQYDFGPYIGFLDYSDGETVLVRHVLTINEIDNLMAALAWAKDRFQ